MKINLLDIPEEGKSFQIDNKSGEINEALKDLIGNSMYSAQFRITPMQSGTFELRGQIKTESPEECSRCGEDFKFNIDEKFSEILMAKLEVPRNGFYAKPNHLSDVKETEQEVFEYEGNTFDAGEFFHEKVGLTIPFNPAPVCDSSGKCVLCEKDTKAPISYEDPGYNKPESPFASLKNIKLK